MNLIDVHKMFATDDQCLDYLERTRWPDGVRCPICGANEVSRIQRKTESKNKRNRIYQCLEKTCKQQFTATAGTIFHDSHLPLTKWFTAVALIVDAKKGMSALQLKRHLRVNYRTAWYLAHRIRKAMEEGDGLPLSGTVEVDETYFGGKTIRRSNRGNRKYQDKDAVVGMIERGGRVRFRHLGKGSATVKAVRPIVLSNISPDVERVITDEAMIYPIVFDGHCASKHETINHSREYVRGDVHTNTIESAFSLLKRAVIGNFHQVSIKHLHRYLNEFEYRFNRRKDADIFEQTVRRLTGGKGVSYKQLIGKASAAV
jgi:transposase-like protein